MRRYHVFKICVLGLIVLIWQNAYATQDDLINRMKAGGHILMIRHAFAPGTGDPANFQLGDCSTQRNLDDRGRAQARAIGEWLRSQGIERAQIYSSQWCRCLDTATLLNLGSVNELSALNSFHGRPEDREPNLEALRKFISEQPADGELIILVTHFVTISGISGEGVSSGAGVLLQINKDDLYRVIGRVEFDS